MWYELRQNNIADNTIDLLLHDNNLDSVLKVQLDSLNSPLIANNEIADFNIEARIGTSAKRKSNSNVDAINVINVTDSSTFYGNSLKSNNDPSLPKDLLNKGNKEVDGYFGRDTMLTDIMLYWVTGAIGSSFWPYYARMHSPWPIPIGKTVDVPTGYIEFPKEILTPPRSVADLFYSNIQSWTKCDVGGHFAALEQPDAFVADLRKWHAILDVKGSTE